MVCYSYLKEGEWLGYPYYTPEVLVSIPKPDGSGQVNFVIETDSGAAITLLPYAAAVLLGIDLKDGIPVQLGGVGGSVFVCYVHKLDMHIGESVYYDIPVAIAPTNDFPPLLGRLGLYDQANVLMDNDNHACCVGEAEGEILPAPGASFFDIVLGWEFAAVAVVGGLLAVVMLTR